MMRLLPRLFAAVSLLALLALLLNGSMSAFDSVGLDEDSSAGPSAAADMPPVAGNRTSPMGSPMAERHAGCAAATAVTAIEGPSVTQFGGASRMLNFLGYQPRDSISSGDLLAVGAAHDLVCGPPGSELAALASTPMTSPPSVEPAPAVTSVTQPAGDALPAIPTSGPTLEAITPTSVPRDRTEAAPAVVTAEPQTEAVPTATASERSVEAVTATPAPQPPPVDQNAQSNIEQQFGAALFSAINGARSTNGLAAFTVHGSLQLAAEQYARLLLARGLLDHGLHGQPWDRAQREGYPSQLVGEVLALSETSAPLDVGEQTNVLLNSWLTSPGHRDIIMSKDLAFSEAGVGCATGQDAGGMNRVICVGMAGVP